MHESRGDLSAIIHKGIKLTFRHCTPTLVELSMILINVHSFHFSLNKLRDMGFVVHSPPSRKSAIFVRKKVSLNADNSWYTVYRLTSQSVEVCLNIAFIQLTSN